MHCPYGRFPTSSHRTFPLYASNPVTNSHITKPNLPECVLMISELFINIIGGILFIAAGAIAVQNYTYQGEFTPWWPYTRKFKAESLASTLKDERLKIFPFWKWQDRKTWIKWACMLFKTLMRALFSKWQLNYHFCVYWKEMGICDQRMTAEKRWELWRHSGFMTKGSPFGVWPIMYVLHTPGISILAVVPLYLLQYRALIKGTGTRD